MHLSVKMASSAEGMAPSKIRLELTVATPLKMGSPNPPAPMRAARVAVPMTMTAAVRSPAKIMGSASGISTFKRIEFQ